MTSSAEAIARKLASVPTIDATIIGTFVEQSGALAVVDVGDARITIPNVGSVTPIPGDSVRLLRVDKQTLLLGITPKAPFGRVTVGGTDTVTVEYPDGSGVTKAMQSPSGLVLAVNDIVSIDWDKYGVVGAKYAAAPGTVAPPNPSPSPAPTQHRQVFTATDSGSHGTTYGWNTNEVWASDSYTGAWFYGTKIADTIPDAAVINSISVYLPIRQSSGAAPNFRVHTSASKPGGAVTFTGATYALNPRSGWVALPGAVGDLLKANLFGVGMNHGGYSIYRGIQGDGLSGGLDITWTI